MRVAATILVAACLGCSSSKPSPPVSSPSIDLCVDPMIAQCLSTDAGLAYCEARADTNCGLPVGVSAQYWSAVVQAEAFQGCVPKR